ncbi:DUF7302 family protein [Nocardia sp. NPDC055002]
MILRHKENKQAVEVDDEFGEKLIQGGLFEKIPATRGRKAAPQKPAEPASEATPTTE